jgi:UTP--glucose-1-phosphate uridylyltransferase
MLARPRITKAVIPAAGFGTRMMPATKALPKEMLPVAGKPLIQYAIEEIAASGITSVIVVVRDHKSLIQSHFEPDSELESFLASRGLAESTDALHLLNRSLDFQYVEQKQPLGLAHAISCAKSLLAGEPFAVLLPDVIMAHDDPVTRQLIRSYDEHGGSVVAIREIQPQDVQRHGIVRIEHSGSSLQKTPVRITGLVEKPAVSEAPSRFGIFGRYILEHSIWEAIDQTSPDHRGEVQLTDALNALCHSSPVFGLCFQGVHHDAGDRLGFVKANLDLSLRDTQLRQPLLEYLEHLHLVN